MESKELMIGDWVYFNPNVFKEDVYVPDYPSGPRRIESGEDIDLAIEGCYSPIPLTPEILEKNGFVYEKDYGAFYRSRWGDKSSPKYVTVSWGYDKMAGFDIQNADNLGILSPKKVAYGRWELSVHEFQQSLRLCGLTELANNFIIE